MIVLRVKKIGRVLVLVHVAPVITPPRGFGDDRELQLRDPFRPPLRVDRRGQRAAVKQVLVRAVRKRQSILGAIDQAGVQTARHIRVDHAIVVRPDEQLLAIPRDVFEPALRRPFPNRVPIAVIAPILIRPEKVQQHVIGEVRHVPVIQHTHVIAQEVLITILDDIHHRVVRVDIAVNRLRWL